MPNLESFCDVTRHISKEQTLHHDGMLLLFALALQATPESKENTFIVLLNYLQLHCQLERNMEALPDSELLVDLDGLLSLYMCYVPADA